MLKRDGEPALDEGATPVEELARAGEDNDAAVRRQTMGAVTQPANTTCRPASSTHRRDNRVYGFPGTAGKTVSDDCLCPSCDIRCDAGVIQPWRLSGNWPPPRTRIVPPVSKASTLTAGISCLPLLPSHAGGRHHEIGDDQPQPLVLLRQHYLA
jgi:hypothetical protein